MPAAMNTQSNVVVSQAYNASKAPAAASRNVSTPATNTIMVRLEMMNTEWWTSMSKTWTLSSPGLACIGNLPVGRLRNCLANKSSVTVSGQECGVQVRRRDHRIGCVGSPSGPFCSACSGLGGAGGGSSGSGRPRLNAYAPHPRNASLTRSRLPPRTASLRGVPWHAPNSRIASLVEPQEASQSTEIADSRLCRGRSAP